MTQAVLAEMAIMPTLPNCIVAPRFDDAWRTLSADLRDARHFESVHEALAHYRNDAVGIPVSDRMAVIVLLERWQKAQIARPSRASDLLKVEP